MTEPYKGYIGLEFEFFTDKPLSNEVIENYKITTEFYDNMYEFNHFICAITFDKTLVTQLNNFFIEVNSFVNKFKEEIYASYNIEVVLHTVPIPAGKSLSFNGVHFHFSVQNKDKFIKVKRRWKLKNAEVGAYFIEKLPSLRKNISHHIWGRYRRSRYNFKKKDRYQPVIITGIPTVEVRCIDCEDILFEDRRKITATILSKMMRKSLSLQNFILSDINIYVNDSSSEYVRLPLIKLRNMELYGYRETFWLVTNNYIYMFQYKQNTLKYSRRYRKLSTQSHFIS